MKIRTQLYLSAAVFGIALLIIAASVVTITAQLDRLDRQANIATRIGLASADLNYLGNEYLLYGEPQQLDRWNQQYTLISDGLASLNSGSPGQPTLVATIAGDLERLKAVFDDIAARSDPRTPADPASLQVSWSRLGVQTQGLAYDASRLSALYGDEADRLRSLNTMLIAALLGTFSVFLLTSYLVVTRRTLRSLAALQAGAAIIGSGDLDHAIPVTSNNEVGDVARSFNRMAADLRTVTASRSELELEVVERTRAEAERARLTLQVAAERNRLAAILDAIPDSIGIHDPDGRYAYVNPTLAAAADATPADLIGRTWADLGFDMAAIEPLVAAVRGAFTSGEVRLGVYEHPVGGTNRVFHAVATPIRNEEQQVAQVIVSSRDITALRDAEETLRESEEKYRMLFDSLDEGFCLIEVIFDDAGRPVDYRFLEANPAFEKQTGLHDPIGKRMRDLVPDHEEHWFEIYGAIARTGEPRRFVQTAIPLIQGWYEVYAFPIGEPGSNLVAVLFNDVTERMESEEALRKYAEDLRRSNEDLERYAYVSSHDLQEPLRSIVSFSQLLERRYKGQLGEDADEYIAFIVEGGDRMQSLILDLLAYSRVNTVQQALRPTDVVDVLAAVERHLDLQLREAGAVITYDRMPVVMADPLQLEQVLANLVSNAIKFRRPDEPLRIHIGARRSDDFWEFSVADNGIGIEEEYFDRIFVIFQRLHTKDAYPGTGIGLAIVKRIVDRHGGRVGVESTPGEGTTFLFTMPTA